MKEQREHNHAKSIWDSILDKTDRALWLKGAKKRTLMASLPARKANGEAILRAGFRQKGWHFYSNERTLELFCGYLVVYKAGKPHKAMPLSHVKCIWASKTGKHSISFVKGSYKYAVYTPDIVQFAA